MSPFVQLALVTFIGGLGWTLTEYLMHRFRAHGPKNRSPFQREHRQHHAISGYVTPLGRKTRMAAGPLAMLLVASSLLLGITLGAAFTFGYGFTYVAYEFTHSRLHTHPPRGPWGRLLRRHHFGHHFHDASGNHGVTSPIWDLVFGTYRPVERVRVPARYVMPWLLEGDSGVASPRYASEYQIMPSRKR